MSAYAPTDTDRKVLELLAHHATALERREIAELLGWSKKHVGEVLLRLVQAELVEATPGTRDDTTALGGRPPALYSLPGMAPAKPGEAAGPHYRPHTIVVTPSGREARVVAMRPGGYCEIEYVVVRLGHEPRTTIKARLLRAFQAGRERPPPIRLEFGRGGGGADCLVVSGGAGVSGGGGGASGEGA